MKTVPTKVRISGKSISSGLADGKTFVHRDILRSLDFPVTIHTKNIEEEFSHLEDATSLITDDLIVLATKVEKEMDAKLASVFEAHQLILNDPSLKEELRAEIRQNLVSAGSAVRAVFLRWEKRFLLMESQVARQKGDDMRDLSRRLSNALKGIKVHPLEEIPHKSILVASRLLPSDTIFLSQHSASGVLLEYCGTGSHAALFVREMGIPCITDISRILRKIPSGAWSLMDAFKGQTIINPSRKDKDLFLRKVAAGKKSYEKAMARAGDPAVTRAGVRIAVRANIGSRADAASAEANGADGIGLYRTEQTYMGRTTPPDVDELYEEMRHVLEPVNGKPICIRLLDIGADKPLPFIGFLAESNPALGRRGIRLLREYSKVLETQLRAVLMLSREFDVSLLIPMIALPEDVAFVKNMLARIIKEKKAPSLPLLGAMIETPAAALSVPEIAPHVDFLTIGTNDLTQYTFAADRENAAVERYFKDSSEAIFRLIRIVHADAPDLPLSVCGELAGRLKQIPKLLKCGITTLSVAPAMIPIIKETIRMAKA